MGSLFPTIGTPGLAYEPLLGNPGGSPNLEPPNAPIVINVKRPHLHDGGPAFIEFGNAAQFDVLEQPVTEQPYETASGHYPPDPPKKPGQPTPPAPPNPANVGKPIFHWIEMGRTTNVIRIENPSDSKQFVDVERIESILFQAPDGSYHQFDLNNGSGGDGSSLTNDPGGFGDGGLLN